MENDGKIKQKNIKSDFLDKEILKSYLDFISRINITKDEDSEKILLFIFECLTEITNSNFFTKEFIEESEIYFISTFSPSFIKKLSNEFISKSSIKDYARSILDLYCEILIKNFENPKLLEIWESLVDILNEDKQFNRSLDNDASVNFLVNFYIKYFRKSIIICSI